MSKTPKNFKNELEQARKKYFDENRQNLAIINKIFDDWTKEVAMSNKTQFRASLFYKFAKKIAEMKLNKMNEEEIKKFELNLKKVWKQKENEGKIIRTEHDKSSFKFA